MSRCQREGVARRLRILVAFVCVGTFLTLFDAADAATQNQIIMSLRPCALVPEPDG